MRIAKPRRRRSIYSDLVNRTWLTLETSAELHEERRAQMKKLERHLQLYHEREFSRRHFRGRTRGTKISVKTIDRVKRKILGLLVLGIALVPFASSAVTTGAVINYVSQTASTVTADYFGLPANSQLIFVSNSTGATTTRVAALSGTSTITVSTITVPSDSYYLRATTPTGGYIAQTIMFDVSNLVRLVSQSNLAQGNINGGGGDGVFIKRPYAYVAEGSGTTNAFQIF